MPYHTYLPKPWVTNGPRVNLTISKARHAIWPNSQSSPMSQKFILCAILLSHNVLALESECCILWKLFQGKSRLVSERLFMPLVFHLLRYLRNRINFVELGSNSWPLSNRRRLCAWFPSRSGFLPIDNPKFQPQTATLFLIEFSQCLM